MIAAQLQILVRFRGWRVLTALILLGLPLVGAAQEATGWLLLNVTTGDCLLATDPVEKARLQQDGWKLNGALLFLPAAEPGAKALHRLARRDNNGTDRMLSANGGEVAACIKNGFADEGVLGLVAPSQSRPELIPVYRFRKERKNLWLIDKSDQPWAEKNGWKLDGVGFWVLPAAGR
jgi:hypothetical protein